MFSIPNSIIVALPVQHRLRNLFAAVESTADFQQFTNKRWSVDCAELVSLADVQKDYVESGERRQQDWAVGLKRAIAGIPELAVFGICVQDREEFERFPTHVFGWHSTFFVDAETSVVVFAIKGPISK